MRVTIGSPIYDKPEPEFVVSIIALLDELRERGHKADWRYRSGIVHWARNRLMSDMLREDPAVLVQIDADHDFKASDVAEAVEAVGERHADVLGFAHPGRKPNTTFASPKVSVGRPGFQRRGKRYIEVDSVGGGILVCSRSAIEKMSEGVPRHVRGNAPMLFDFGVSTGEDAFFCNRWREMGGKVHCDVTSKIGHIGSHTYVLDPAEIVMSLDMSGKWERRPPWKNVDDDKAAE